MGPAQIVRAVVAVALALALPTAAPPASAQAAGSGLLPRDRQHAVVYVSLGDSGAAGVGATRPEMNAVGRLYGYLRAVYPSAHFTNLAVSGADSTAVVRSQLPRAVALHPDLVTIAVGGNDILRDKGVEQFDRNLDLILSSLTREAAVVVVNNIGDLALAPRFRRSERAEQLTEQVVHFNEALARLAARHGADVVDMFTIGRRALAQRRGLIAGDGFHPSDAGYAAWADEMWKSVRPHIPTPGGAVTGSGHRADTPGVARPAPAPAAPR